MKIISKNLSVLTKILLVAIILTGFSVDSIAQKKEKKSKKAKKEKVIERPASVGDANTDAFVKSSFDIYEKNKTISKKLSDAKGSLGDASQLKSDLETQMNDITGLLGKAGDVMKGAKAISPKSNSMKAVGALNKATKALNATKNAIPGQMEQIKSQESN